MFFRKRLFNNERKEIFTDIFEKIYSRLECNIIYVFLCGGNGDSDEHIRDKIRQIIEENHKEIKILYPEHLFFEKDSTQLTEFFREKDLLELETILAHNSNIVCIICESMGSATELGAFTNYNKEILNKIVSVIYEKYNDKVSFISEGPIKRIKTLDESRLKVYDFKKHTRRASLPEKQKKLSEKLVKEFKKICNENKKLKGEKIFIEKDSILNNFIGLAYLILIIIYFYQKINSNILIPLLKKELKELNIQELINFDTYYSMSIRFLIDNQELAIKNSDNEFELTDKGLKYIRNDLFNFIKIDYKDVDYIRTRVMHKQYYGTTKKGDYTS